MIAGFMVLHLLNAVVLSNYEIAIEACVSIALVVNKAKPHT